MSTALGKNNMKLKNNIPFFAARCMRWQQQLEIKMSGFFFKIDEATPLCFPVMTEALSQPKAVTLRHGILCFVISASSNLKMLSPVGQKC